jgi:hypothetical protein
MTSGGEDTRMIRPLNTNKSSPRSRGGGSLICRQNCWQKPPLNLQADEIPRRPKGSVGMTSGGEGARTRGWFGHSTRTNHPPAPAAAGAQFVGRIVGRIVGRNNPLTYKRMRFLLARRACVGMTSGGGEPHAAETECGITSPLCKSGR